jgi:hypothetical protein
MLLCTAQCLAACAMMLPMHADAQKAVTPRMIYIVCTAGREEGVLEFSTRVIAGTAQVDNPAENGIARGDRSFLWYEIITASGECALSGAIINPFIVTQTSDDEELIPAITFIDTTAFVLRIPFDPSWIEVRIDDPFGAKPAASSTSPWAILPLADAVQREE